MKQIGAITSAERGELVTIVYTVCADGSALPPMFLFPRVNYRDHFIRGSPTGSISAATRNGWMNEATFPAYLQHTINNTRCTKDKPILLIIDNHKSHCTLDLIDLAKENGVVILTIAPHTSHKLQPLSKATFGPFKADYDVAADDWMRNHDNL
jgi:hypothetical protein